MLKARQQGAAEREVKAGAHEAEDRKRPGETGSGSQGLSPGARESLRSRFGEEGGRGGVRAQWETLRRGYRNGVYSGPRGTPSAPGASRSYREGRGGKLVSAPELFFFGGAAEPV
ncbi:hypothetical protein EYF80_049793 [Liparis tanakae]|uniref:Uncharacterized protein n=1 Tax=Liparis tanakae TaxID=230148 RepID=A0A4Z2FGF1_9TELE|nr:hypothetical protein EYF80_049793 [Liparis tanakae]